jgi:hypothetical protein
MAILGTRARGATELFVIDTPTERELDRTEIAPELPAELGDERTPIERLDAAMRQRDDEDLALDRIDRAGAGGRVDRESETWTHPPRAISVGAPSTTYVPNSLSYASASAATPITSQTSYGPPAARTPRHSASRTPRVRASPSSSIRPAAYFAGSAPTPQL